MKLSAHLPVQALESDLLVMDATIQSSGFVGLLDLNDNLHLDSAPFFRFMLNTLFKNAQASCSIM